MRPLGQNLIRCRPRELAVALLLALAFAGCSSDDETAAQPATVAGGNAERGVALIRHYGCGACHQIPGVENADGLVGPPLTRIASRVFLAGVRRNTPDDMIAWLQHPQAIVPGNAMPDMGLSTQDARDVTAYLYTLH